ncbi:MAG: hypothetical protein ABL864_13770 [Terricaulis sp.]
MFPRRAPRRQIWREIPDAFADIARPMSAGACESGANVAKQKGAPLSRRASLHSPA